MYFLYALKLKRLLRRNPASKIFHWATRPYARDLNSNCSKGETRISKTQGCITTLTQQRRQLNLT